MIKSIFKTILILTICLGITLPTYSAISVSDGSAFMTKSEFMADINNLSSRVAQLEISFDGTLDTKVSSYLEQKGFWKAKPQTFAMSGTNPLNQMINVNSHTITSSGSVKNSVELRKQDLINNISASGMCLLTLAYKANGTDDGKMMWGYLCNQTTGSYFNSNIMLTAIFYEKLSGSTTEEIKSTIVLGNGVGQMEHEDSNGQSTITAIMLPKVETYMPTMFFVTKGSKLSWSLWETYGIASITGGVDNSYYFSGVDVTIKSCVVY